MSVSIPIQLYESLEDKYGARDITKTIEISFEAIDEESRCGRSSKEA